MSNRTLSCRQAQGAWSYPGRAALPSAPSPVTGNPPERGPGARSRVPGIWEPGTGAPGRIDRVCPGSEAATTGAARVRHGCPAGRAGGPASSAGAARVSARWLVSTTSGTAWSSRSETQSQSGSGRFGRRTSMLAQAQRSAAPPVTAEVAAPLESCRPLSARRWHELDQRLNRGNSAQVCAAPKQVARPSRRAHACTTPTAMASHGPAGMLVDVPESCPADALSSGVACTGVEGPRQPAISSAITGPPVARHTGRRRRSTRRRTPSR